MIKDKLKKNITKILILILMFSFKQVETSAATMIENIKFNNLTIEEGLSQSTVDKIYQDSKGYIWIATNDGLNRYNGSEFKYYKNDKYNKNSIASNYIVDIIEDERGHIWVSTTGGISRINPDTDEVENYYAEGDKGNLSKNSICQILVTKDGRIIAATEEGLNLYDEENNEFVRILDGEDELPSQYIYSIKQDFREHIWIGTDSGLVEFDKDFNRLNGYEDTIGSIDVYTTYDDLNGHIWVCSLYDGLYKINLNDKSVVSYKHSDEDENSIASDTVKDVVMDSKRILWIATNEGLCSYDYENDVFKSYKKEPYEKDGLLDDKTRCLFIDRSGLIWVGQYSGISIFNPISNFYNYKSKPNNPNSLSDNIIYALYKDKDKALWVGTSEKGVDIISNDSVTHLNKDNSNLISNKIFDIIGIDNQVFIGTNDGLSVAVKNDYGSYDIKNYTNEDGLPANKIRSLFADSKGYVWIGTTKGIAVLNSSNGELQNISNILDDMGVSDKFIRAVYEDSKGNYYLGCFLEGGLIKINPNTKEYKIYKNDEDDNDSISSNTIRYITEDLDGNVLVGTSNGLNILNSHTDTFKHYTENDGLVNNTVYGILVDKNNKIWMSTNGGISKFSIKDGSFKNFTVQDGLISNEFNGRACFGAKDGYLYFGSMDGVSVININNVELSTFKPKVIFDSFEVNGIAKKHIDNAKFKYNQNNIKVNFFSDDYKDTKRCKYYYRLSGLEQEWNTTNSSSLTFANLAPGNYTLEMKTMTQHGVMSEVNSVSFTIKTPYWKSNAAIVIYIALIALAIYSQVSKVKRLDKLVDKRTKELKGQMKKNEKLYNHVIELEQTKNNYFVNLSHELRTPLNILMSTNQLIESLSNDSTLISKEKISYYINIMNRNCNRLLSLINNLIDYAKLENNTYLITKEKVDIVSLVEDTVFDMKGYIEENGIEFVFDTDTEEKVINCDKLDIERCIINLVGNAVKFTPEGGLIEVSLYDLKDKIKIVVKDNGSGISEENQRVIFDRFNQGKKAGYEQKGGSGLGLTITKQILTLHGGDIYVNSKLGSGSEFVIILPVS